MKTVLVGDDTAFVRDRFRSALEAAGHRVITVATGPELLAALRDQRNAIDLIIIDLRLPQSNGLELLRTIRKIDSAPATILVFSGTIGSASEVQKLSQLGVAGYVNEYAAVQHLMPALAPHLFPGEYNRRGGPRVVLGVPLTYRFGNTIATALTLNVSHGGIAVRTTTPLAVGAVVRIRFKLPGGNKEIEAEARVAWRDSRLGMGLQFAAIDADSQKAIDTFAQSRFFSNRKA